MTVEATRKSRAAYMREYRKRPGVYEREFQFVNPDLIAARNASRRADQYGVENTATEMDYRRLWLLPCAECDDGTPAGGVDHIVPIAFGGGHVLENLQPMHLKCNQRKNGRETGRGMR